MANAAIGAENNQERNTIFKNKEHENFISSIFRYIRVRFYKEKSVETWLYFVSNIILHKRCQRFLEAIKTRYSDRCCYVDWEDMFYAED